MKLTVTVPVFNGEGIITKSVLRLTQFLARVWVRDWTVLLAENGSRDRTPEICDTLAEEIENVRVFHLKEPGRGRALSKAWLEDQDSDILAYMDADLATDLQCLPMLVNVLGGADIAIGNRLLRGSTVMRGLKREIISRGYSAIVRRLFRTEISDFQCGFKAAWRRPAHRTLPFVKDTGWFWDTEFLLKAEALGFTVTPVTVNWTDQPHSTVRIIRTATEDLKGLLRLRKEIKELKARRQANRVLAC